jgi:hypothetical protein
MTMAKNTTYLDQSNKNKNNQEKTLFVEAITTGLSDITQGKTMTLTEAKKQLGIK